jgi:hypothetical protein
MIQYNVDSAGGILRVNFNQDISAADSFTMEIQPTYGDLQNLIPTLGTTDVEVGDGKYLANQYVNYTITQGQFTAGDTINSTTRRAKEGQIWRKKAVALTGGVPFAATQFTQFRVTE